MSDISTPQLVGQLRHHPPFAGKLSGARCHTVLPLSKRDYAVMTSEGERFHVYSKEQVNKSGRSRSTSSAWWTSPTRPTRRSSRCSPIRRCPTGYPYKNFNEIPGWGAGPFGPHNIHEPHYDPVLEDRNDRIYCAYFHAGLRVYDINDPYVPKEIAYFIPPDPEDVGLQQRGRGRLPWTAHGHDRGRARGSYEATSSWTLSTPACTCCAALSRRIGRSMVRHRGIRGRQEDRGRDDRGSALAAGASALDEGPVEAAVPRLRHPVPDRSSVKTEAEAVAAAARIGGKVVMKGIGADIHHKTEAGWWSWASRAKKPCAETFRLLKSGRRAGSKRCWSSR